MVTWRLGRRLGGPFAGLIALLLLATCPLYYGHMFMNAKDAPFAVAMVIALLGIVRTFEEYPRPTPPTVVLCGVGIGLASARASWEASRSSTRCCRFCSSSESGIARDRMEAALGEYRQFLVPFIPGAILAYLVMGLVWPWSVVSPLNPFRAVEYFSNFFERPWRELFDGRLILVPDMPRGYVPTLAALTLPELMLALGLCGIIGAIVVAARGRPGRLGASAGHRAALLAVVLAALLPVVVTVATRPAMYNGIRHFVFLTPPLAVLGGLAGAWMARRLERYGRSAMAAGAAILMAGLAFPIVDMVRLHPYEYTHFNHIAGGVAGARPFYMIDYWGLSIRQASLELQTVLAQRGETPKGEKWTVAVCGPHPAAVVALGPQYSADLGPERRRLRHDARRVLLRQTRCAGPA